MVRLEKTSQRWVGFVAVIWSIFAGIDVAVGARAVAPLDTVDSRVIIDSDEAYEKRIYAYDMIVESNDDVHIVYSKPTEGGAEAINYLRRVSGRWTRGQTLTIDGVRLGQVHMLRSSDGTVHVSYLRERGDGLFYRRIANGKLGPEILVNDGKWISDMQLDGRDRPIFVRENHGWPESESRLVLLETTNGVSWTASEINLPDEGIVRFRLAQFIYSNGGFHILYGDSAIMKPVIKRDGGHTSGIFHNVYYASSEDGGVWKSIAIDRSGTLYEDEFWTSLIVDRNKVLGAFYRYAEYGGVYNTGTSLFFFEITPEAVTGRNITATNYPDTREGMGVGLLVRAEGDYWGGWDFSADDTHSPYFRGERGNLALARNGEDGRWTDKLQVDPFSAEGDIIPRVTANSLHLLFLGDFVDAKLYYRELDLEYLEEQFDLVSGGFPWGAMLPAIIGAPQI
jgi:hypothetical protein